MKKLFFLTLVAFVFVCQAVASEPIGVVVNNNTNGFHFINPLTQQISDPMLKGDLGSYGGGLFDVVFSKDGKKLFISNFGDSTVLVVDISGGFNGTPTLLATITLPFFAEDLDITADGKYVLVTDGGFSPRIAVISVADLVIVQNHYLGVDSAQAVATIGNVVVVADYFGAMLHSYTIDGDGMITPSATVYLNASRPVNVAISPDGKTVIAACSNRYDAPVFSMDETGGLNYHNSVTFPAKGGQSVVFSNDGKKAYYYSNSVNHGPMIQVLKVNSPGEVELETSIELSIPRGTSQLFGVDTIAIDPSGNYLYVSNPTVSGGVVEVTVIDLATNTEVNQLPCLGIPTGIAFGTIQ